MTCRNCGTDIADKALICYRCGTATSERRITPPAERPRRGPLPVVVTLLLIVLGAVLAVPQLAEGTPRLLGWIAVVILTVVTVLTLRPGPRGR